MSLSSIFEPVERNGMTPLIKFIWEHPRFAIGKRDILSPPMYLFLFF
jgi:hypothetical protein